MRGRRARANVLNDVSDIPDGTSSQVPPKKRRVRFADVLSNDCLSLEDNSNGVRFLDVQDVALLGARPQRQSSRQKVNAGARSAPKAPARKTRSDKGKSKSLDSQRSIQLRKTSWKKKKKLQASHARSFIVYAINGKVAAKSRKARHALEARQDHKIRRLRSTSISPLAHQSPITTSLVSKKARKSVVARDLQQAIDKESTMSSASVSRTKAATALGISPEQVDEFGQWVQENRKVPKQPRLLRDDMISHLFATYGTAVSKKTLSKALHLMGFEFVDPKNDYFDNRRSLDSTQQHMQRVIVFMEFLEHHSEFFSVGYQDETSPCTNIKDHRLWTKADAPPSERYCQDFKPGKGPALSISAAVDVKSGEFIRKDGKVVGTVQYASSNEKSEKSKKRNMETGPRFAQLIGELCHTLSARYKGTIPVIFCDSPNIHRSAFSADISNKLSVSKMNLAKGDNSLKSVLLEQNLWRDDMTLKEAREIYRQSSHYRRRRMRFFTDVEVHAYIQRGILLFNANSCPDFNIIEQYWRHGHARYEKLGNQSKKELLDSWKAFLEEDDNAPFFERRKHRVEQMRRHALANPGAPKLRECDIARKTTKNGKRKWVELSVPTDSIEMLHEEILGTLDLHTDDAYNRLFAYAHYLNTVRMNGPAKGHSGVLMTDMPAFNFEEMWSQWESELKKQVQRIKSSSKSGSDAQGSTKNFEPPSKDRQIQTEAESKKKLRKSKKPEASMDQEVAVAVHVKPRAKVSNDQQNPASNHARNRATAIPSDLNEYMGDFGVVDYSRSMKEGLKEMRTYGSYISDTPLWCMMDLLKQYIPPTMQVMPLMRFQQVTFTVLRGHPQDIDPQRRQQFVRVDAQKVAGKTIIVFPAFINTDHYVLYVADTRTGIVALYNSKESCKVAEQVQALFLEYLQLLVPTRKWAASSSKCCQQLDESNDCAIYMISFIRSLIISRGTTIDSSDGPQAKESASLAKKRSIALRRRFAEEIDSKTLRVWQ